MEESLRQSELKVSRAESEAMDAASERDAALSSKLELEAKVGAAEDERKTLLTRYTEVKTDLRRFFVSGDFSSGVSRPRLSWKEQEEPSWS